MLGALLGAAASIGGSILGASSTKKGAKKAADTALAVADKNNALALNIFGQNKALLSPYSERGNQAGTAINALLGLGGPPQAAAPVSAPQGYTQPMNALAGGYGAGNGGRYFRPAEVGEDPLYPMGAPGTPAPAAPQAAPAGASPYESSFNNFLDSTGFRFQMNEGDRAINTGYAARGALQSGAAMKALQERGQQTALNNYFLPYMGLLQGQQATGMGAASAVAGVGQNYVNNVTANNNSAGSAAANAALTKGAANYNMWGGIAQNIGNLFTSSYRP